MILWILAALLFAVWYYGVFLFLNHEWNRQGDDDGARRAAQAWPLTLLIVGICLPIADLLVWYEVRKFKKRLDRIGVVKAVEREKGSSE